MRRWAAFERRPQSSRHRLLLLVAVLAMLVAACSPAGATPAPDEHECALGLDLWDTDPALTWIEDGRVWVRTGDLQACLSHTTATHLAWGPDGRRVLLDDRLFEAGREQPTATIPAGAAIAWQQPFGEALYAKTAEIAIIGEGPALPPDTSLVASHPDGLHYAVAAPDGNVTLVNRSGNTVAGLFSLRPGEELVQMEFGADGARLWALIDADGSSTVRYVDMIPISDVVDVPPTDSIVPGMTLPVPELFYVETDEAAVASTLAVGIGASGTDITRFALHPAHRDWVAITEGSCQEARSSLFVAGAMSADDFPGTAIGFFRGHGQPVLATTTAGGDCGTGQLWVAEDLLGNVVVTLVADDVASAAIRVEAPDPWNPNSAPPFA